MMNYTKKPREYAAYFQDKMEFDDLIINDWSACWFVDPDGFVLTDPTDPSIYNPIKPTEQIFMI